MASSGFPRGRGGGLLGLSMRLEGAREGELPQPVADHVLRDVDGYELPPVVHGEGVAHELRRDGGAPRPGLQHLLLALTVELLDPLLQPLVDVRPLLGRSSHGLPLLLRPARHDVAVRGARAAAGLVSLGRLAPRSHRMVALALAFATAHRVVDGVHHGAAHSGAEAPPAYAPCLAHGNVLMVEVADLPHRGHTLELDLPDFARGQLEVRVIALLGEELGEGARAAAELAALADLQLHVVHEGAERNVPDGQRVAGKDVRLRPRHHHVPGLEPQRRDDVALLAVLVVEERNARGAAWIVLDACHLGGDAELVPLEVHLAQHALVPAAPMPDGDAPVGVAAVRPLLWREQALLRRLLGDLLVGEERHVAPRRRGRLQCADSHRSQAPSTSSILWPGASVTIAFFQSERLPSKRPMRFHLPCIEAVRTSATFTLNTRSTAWRISTLLASRATSNVTVLNSSFCCMLFSVMRG